MKNYEVLTSEIVENTYKYSLQAENEEEAKKKVLERAGDWDDLDHEDSELLKARIDEVIEVKE